MAFEKKLELQLQKVFRVPAEFLLEAEKIEKENI